MALAYDQVTAVTEKLINESVADNTYNASPLLIHMKTKGKVGKDGGDAIKLPVIWKEIAAGGAFRDYGLLSVLPTDNITSAEYEWKRYYVNVAVSRHELLRNSGESGAVNLLRAKVASGEMQMIENLADDMFSANADTADGIVGLQTIVKATGQVGEIDQSDFSGWASDVDAATSALTLSAVEQQILDASRGSDGPDIGVTGIGVYKKLWSKYQAVQRFGGEKAAKGGFEYLLVNGIPIVWDRHVSGSNSSSTADNHFYFLNSRWLYFFVHKDDDFKTEKIGRIAEQDIVVTQMTTTIAFGTDNRRMHSAFTVLKA